jgi:hypothetical protein
MVQHAVIRSATLLGLVALARTQLDETTLLQTKFTDDEYAFLHSNAESTLRLAGRETIKLVTIVDPANSLVSSCPRGCGNWGQWNDAKQNAPTCCLEQSKQAFYSIADAFAQEHVAHSLNGGSLVGALRGGDMISWDYDVDFLVYTSAEHAAVILNSWVSREKQSGGLLAQFHVGIGASWWVDGDWIMNGGPDMNSGGDVHLDIGFSNPDPLHPPTIRPCSFGARVVQCRADAASFLDGHYQGDWMVPHRWCSWKSKTLCPEAETGEDQKCSVARQHLRSHTCADHPQLLIGRGGC